MIEPRAGMRVLDLGCGSGGQLAVHLYAQFEHPSLQIAVQVANESPFREAVRGYTRQIPVLTPPAYATVLHRLGFTSQLVRLQIYGHLLANRGEVVEWA